MKKSHFVIYLLVGAALCWAVPCVVEADVVSFVTLSNPEPVKDAIGRNLPGNWERPDIASRVEIRSVGTGIVAPDPQTGESDEAANPLVASSFIGENVPGPNLGKFSHTFSDRAVLAGGAFARVYDNYASQGAVYYWDSQVIQDVPTNQWQVTPSLDVIFGERQVIDTVNYPGDPDTDGDGIPDAMEMEMGLDPGVADTDGDGYDDLFEVLNGLYLQPSDPDPSLTIALTREVAPEGNPQLPAILSWDTIPVPAMEYVVQFRPIWEDEEAFSNIWSGVYTDKRIELDVQEWLDDPSFERGFFRVRIPYERP